MGGCGLSESRTRVESVKQVILKHECSGMPVNFKLEMFFMPEHSGHGEMFEY